MVACADRRGGCDGVNDGPQQWMSHETIYRSLLVQARGALKHELTGYLRTRRVMRPRGTNPMRAKTMGQLRDVVSIRERPARGRGPCRARTLAPRGWCC